MTEAQITDNRRQDIETRFAEVLGAFRDETVTDTAIGRMVERLADETERQIEAALLESVPRKYYTVDEAARMLSCSTRSVYRAIAEGTIPKATTVIGQTRIPAAEFDTLT